MLRPITLTAALFCAAPALAHVSFDTRALPADQALAAALIVPHGCDGAPTREVRMTVPEGVRVVATAPDGWTIAQVSGGITWQGNLPADVRGVFPVTVTLPASDIGTEFAFPTEQVCDTTTEVWGDGGAGPAPTLVTADPAMAAGDLLIGEVFARATLPGAPVGGGYLTIRNTGTTDDVLLAAGLDVAQTSSLHKMEMTDGIMRMAPLDGGLPIPAGGTVDLQPSGNHIMFERLTGPLVEGETLPLTLTFRDAGTVTVPMTVRAINAGGGSGHHHH
ncbi:copper chaperone PCu(A)C [Falsirhodobacter halotolerans]|uniref:copper chaperone PCu(A)C n=1 Tax=Falsirhodobacter halotolerans TaxID=1146892 RepID=UPI001FD05209|nr:copper chaperone PCu(A)C [Falsirhodobacter halotolerans]MCJ8139846.1 copper chaperone PCu(A)C [Falsirhodobacter halotolerans]